MSRIVVSISELGNMLKEAKRHGCINVEVSIDPAEDDFPATLMLSSYVPNDADLWIDFDPIEAVEDNDELLEKSDEATHCSSNIY